MEQIELPISGEVLGMPYPDWPENLTTFAERKVYQLGVAHGKAVQKHRDDLESAQLVGVLIQAIESSGYLVSGPMDVRAAERGEPEWVCNARGVIAEASSKKEFLDTHQPAMKHARKPFTVIGFHESSGQLSCLHVVATDGLNAFAAAAQPTEAKGDFNMVAVMPGHISEEAGLEFPGEGLVTAETVLEQPDVFGRPPKKPSRSISISGPG